MARKTEQPKKVDMITLYRDVFQHIRGHNKYMSEEYLDSLNNRQLLMEVHPTYYDYFKRLFYPTY